jgi:hypothetical protein
MSKTRRFEYVVNRNSAIHLNDDLPKKEFTEQQIDLTHLGHRLLANRADFIRDSGIDRWIGGVDLTPQNDWRWNRSALQLRRQES